MSTVARNETSTAFMLAEYNSLQAHVVKLEDAKTNRVNFFLVVVAAVTAGTSGVMGNSNYQDVGNFIIATGSLGLLILGLTILNQLIIYSESIIGLYRRAGRIRRWFVESDKSITQYLPFEASDDRPGMKITVGYLELRGGDVIIRMLNSIFFAIFVIAFVSGFYSLPYLLAIAASLPLAVIFWYVQQNRVRARLQRIEEHMKRKVRFPRVDTSEGSVSLPE